MSPVRLSKVEGQRWGVPGPQIGPPKHFEGYLRGGLSPPKGAKFVCLSDLDPPPPPSFGHTLCATIVDPQVASGGTGQGLW